MDRHLQREEQMEKPGDRRKMRIKGEQKGKAMGVKLTDEESENKKEEGRKIRHNEK